MCTLFSTANEYRFMTRRNTMVYLAIALIGMGFPHLAASQSLDTINIHDADIGQVLYMYKDLTGKSLLVASNVKRLRIAFTLRVGPDVSRAEVKKILENALIAQAGIVCTELDGERISITYNDAIPVGKPALPPATSGTNTGGANVPLQEK
jgi:type II secretory pathway component GspD/PulD (secretin)